MKKTTQNFTEREKVEILHQFFEKKLKISKNKMLTSAITNSLLNLISTAISLIILVLAIVALIFIVNKRNSLTAADISAIERSAFVVNLGISYTDAIQLSIITCSFIIISFFINFFVQFFTINQKFKNYRGVNRELSYFLTHLKYDSDYKVEQFIEDCNQTIEYYSKKKFLTFKQFIIKKMKREL
ncbi:hypothetical protein ACA758_04375 [Mycoplasmopsis agassizii]|uniref:Uncharacterized protein n=1 Tax=Mycoplasmopsis agassizii TaxID=33922 RepID=A0ABX4H552_9BACT|nr:hypothetical protein [Mycoplasmopsis agassizii]PAF55020.1 hypothetical protein CJF60_04790 [Mycoplasmopsis agassizii]SMC17524.1 hypothetical protein SAMN02745179_00481 [Mycoplasmopsis agassizii]